MTVSHQTQREIGPNEPRVGHKRALGFVVCFLALRAVSFVLLAEALRSGWPVPSTVCVVLLLAAAMLILLQRPWATPWPSMGLVLLDGLLLLGGSLLFFEGLRISGAVR